MLRNSFFFLTVSLSMFCCQTKGMADAILWLTDYDEALNQARMKHLPLMIFFTGSDWCGWCHKLQDEVLETEEFKEMTEDQFIFLKIDSPMKTPLSPQQTDVNNTLKRRFAIKTFPTVLLVDEKQQEIGRKGYQQGGPKGYAEALKLMVHEYNHYKNQISQLGDERFTTPQLKRLYAKASDLGRRDEMCKIIAKGSTQNKSSFFLLERYRELALGGKFDDEKTRELRDTLLMGDPSNAELTHYRVAVIDFQALCESETEPEAKSAPLRHYIDRFGEKDPANAWQLKTMILQIYLDDPRCQAPELQLKSLMINGD